jgi:tetratricopeptide (TPR) repeat protein
MNSTWQYGDCKRAVDIASKVIHTIEDNKREPDFFGRPFNVYAELHGLCGLAYAFLGRFDEGIASGTKALRFSKDIENLPSRASSEFLLAGLFSIKGDGKNAIQHGKAAIEYCTAAGTDLFLPLANLYLGCGYFYSGELRTADKYLKSALQLQKDMGLQMFTSWVYSNLGYIDMELGNLESAQSHAENALSSSQKTSEKMFEGFAWTLLGRLLRKEEPTQFDKAEEYILKGTQLLEQLKLKAYSSQGYLYLGDLYNDMGRKEEAFEHLRKAEEMFQEMGMDYHLNRTHEALARI